MHYLNTDQRHNRKSILYFAVKTNKHVNIILYSVFGTCCKFNNVFIVSPKADPPKSWQEQLPLIVGSITAILVFIIAVVVIAIVCLRFERLLKK